MKFLIEINEIDFIIKDDNKRKRYFYISKKGAVKSLQDWLKSLLLRQEINQLIQQMIAFTKDIYPFVEDKIKEHFKGV